MEDLNYTSTHPLGQTGPVTGSLYLTFTLSAKKYDDDGGDTVHREPTSKKKRRFSNDFVIEYYCVLGSDTV